MSGPAAPGTLGSHSYNFPYTELRLAVPPRLVRIIPAVPAGRPPKGSETVEDDLESWGTAGDNKESLGMAWVMSHDAIEFLSEVYDFHFC